MDRRRAAGALLALAAFIACTTAAPTASNQTSLDLYDSDASEGCYYNFQHYGEGDRIMTNEPCLNCTCHNRMLMCYLRVCPFTKPIGQNCTNEKRADQCCPIVTCPDVPVDLLTSTSTTSAAEYGSTGVGHLDKYGCSINGRYFPEGSKVPSSPDKPCEHCYCIRNMTTCVMQECTLHVDGCTPIYLKDTCCPVRYSCDHPEDELPMLDDMTTTVRPTPGFLLTTTTMPSVTQIPQNCVHDEKIFPDGALIKTDKACEHCYCMKGDIVCVVQECGTPMENEGKNCTSLPPREGQCCPDTYICDGDNELQIDEITTMPPRKSIEGSGYRHDDEPYTQQPIEQEGSGFEGSGNEGSGIEGSGDESKDSITPEPVVTDDNDMFATTEMLLYSSEKASTEPDKGYNTVPDIEDVTTADQTTEPSTIKSEDIPTSTVKLSSSLPEITISSENPQDYSTIGPKPEVDSDYVTTESPMKIAESKSTDDDKESKSTTVQLPDDTNETHKYQPTTPSLDESFTVTVLETTTKPETSDQPLLTTEKVEKFETTPINLVENEIHEDAPSKTSPGLIPGEGNCLIDGVTYDNDTIVPSNDKCKTNCKCTSSIVKCDQIKCSGPPDDMINCRTVYDTLETCCPTYVCDQGKVTIPPQPDSQMSGTETPISHDCKNDQCSTHDEASLPAQCGPAGCGDEQVTSEVPQQPEVCLDGKCITSSEGCVGDSCKIPTRKTEPCDKEGGCGLPVEETCTGINCELSPPKESPINCENNKDGCEQTSIPDQPIQTCEGVACEHMSSEQPHDDSDKPIEPCNEENNCKTEGSESGEPQKECNDETCTKKQQNDLGNKFDTECEGASCLSPEKVQPTTDVNEVRTETLHTEHDQSTLIPDISPTENISGLSTPHETLATPAPKEPTKAEEKSTQTPEKTADLPTTMRQETFTEADILVTQQQDTATEVPEKTVEASVTESQDKLTDVHGLEIATTQQSEAITEANIITLEPQEKVTLAPETPLESVTESQEGVTDAHNVEEPSPTEKQDAVTDSAEPAEQQNKSTEVPDTIPITESQDKETDAHAFGETSTVKLDMTSIVPVAPVEIEEKATDAPKIAVEQYVPESQEDTTEVRTSEELSPTEKQEIATEKPIQPTQPSPTEILDITSDIPVEPVELQEKATEAPETPSEFPVTETQDESTTVHIAEKPHATEKEEMATAAPIEPIAPQDMTTNVPELTDELSVTESQESMTGTHKPEEPSVTEKQDMTTADTKEVAKPQEATSVPEKIEDSTVTEAAERQTDIPEQPLTTDRYDIATEAIVESTETQEKFTERSETPVELPITESPNRETESHIKTSTDAEEKYEQTTEIPKILDELPVTETHEDTTDSDVHKETYTTEQQELVPLMTQKTVESPVTESHETITDSHALEVPISTEKVDDVVTEASVEPIESQEKVTGTPEITDEASVTESQDKITETPASEVPTGTEKQDTVTEISAEQEPITKETDAPKVQTELPDAHDDESPLMKPDEEITKIPEPEESSVTDIPEKEIKAPVLEPENDEEMRNGEPQESQTSPEPMISEEGTFTKPSVSPPTGDQVKHTIPSEEPVTEEFVHTDGQAAEEPTSTEKQSIPVKSFESEETSTEIPKIPSESPATEPQEKITDAHITEPLSTERYEPTEGTAKPIAPQDNETETPEILVESPVTESYQPQEPSATEKQEKATETYESPVTEFHDIPEPNAHQEPSSTENASIDSVEPQEQATKVPDTPVELPITESQEKITETPEQSTFTEQIHTSTQASVDIVEPQEKNTEIPERSNEYPVTESQAHTITDEHVPKVSPSTETQEMLTEAPASAVTDSQDKITEEPTEKQGTVTDSSSESVESQEKETEIPVESQEKETENPVESPVTESQEKITNQETADKHDVTTESPAASIAPQEMATEVPKMPVESPVTESQDRITDVQVLPESSVTEKQDTATEGIGESVPPQEKSTESPKTPEETLVTEPQNEITDDITQPSVTEKHDMVTEASAETTESHEITTSEQPVESPITESQEEVADMHIPVEPSATEKQDMFTEALDESVHPQDKATEAPEIPVEIHVTESQEGVTDMHISVEPSATEKQDMFTEAVDESVHPQDKATEAPEIPVEIHVTESQEVVTDMHTVEPSATEKQDMFTEAVDESVHPQDKATEAPEIPVEIHVTESQEGVTDMHIPVEPSATEKQDMFTEAVDESVHPQDKATEAPEIPVEIHVTKSQETITNGPEEPASTEKIDVPVKSPATEIVASQDTEAPVESPVTESQDKKATETTPEIHVASEISPPVPEEPIISSVTESEVSSESSVTDLQPPEEPVQLPSTEFPLISQEPDVHGVPTETPVTESHETVTKEQEKVHPTVTEESHEISEVTIASTLEPKLEYSETTPYLVELEEHTHKIDREGSTVADESITVAPESSIPEGIATEETDKPFSGEPEFTEKTPLDTEKDATVPSTNKLEEISSATEPSVSDEEMLSPTATTSKSEQVTTPAMLDKFTKEESKPSDNAITEASKPTTASQLNDDLPLPDFEAGSFQPSGSSGYGQEPDYGEEDQAFGPGTCRYGGKVYVSAQQIPRDDPCDFCFCFRSDIICLQQSCPPPIHGCHEEPIQGFCCPRYECPVSMATTLNVTTTTTTTTTTLPPHFLTHAYKGQAQKRGCQIKGKTYKVGEVVRASSGPCLHCTCGGDGQMKCDPKVCTPEPMLRQMIAAAVSSKRRR